MTEKARKLVTGAGTTSDPNQADRTGLPGRERFTKVPDNPKNTRPVTPSEDLKSGPGTTDDPNQSTNVDLD